jgi:hypothetical protein
MERMQRKVQDAHERASQNTLRQRTVSEHVRASLPARRRR